MGRAGVRLLNISELMQWQTVGMECVDDARLREIAEDFELRQASLQRLGQTWYRQVSSSARDGKLIMIAAGPRHTGPVTEGPPS